MRRIVHPFLVGAIAVLAVHHPMRAALHALGILSWPAYSLAPTRPAVNAARTASTAWIAAKVAGRA